MDLSALPTFRAGALDLNGQFRGKRLPGTMASKLDAGAVRLPLSALNLDIRGEDIVDSPLLFASGDADGELRPTDRGPVAMPWLETPSALVPMWMYTDDGAPFAGDARHALDAVLARYRARGWQVIAATELEFFLLDDSGPTPQPPLQPGTSKRLGNEDILSMDALDAFDAFFTDLYAGAAQMGIEPGAAIAESGVGQFEVNLAHGPAMRAADDAILFKQLVRGMARKHGMAATFMAKPYPEQAGNGLHVHFSVVDDQGRNVFDNGGPEGSDILQQAVAGCLAAMPGSTVIFAPHGPSYDRFAPGAHAPTAAGWGYENRTTAIRIPGGAPTARRIEHRVAGGDVNPYLMLAAVLGAAMVGIEDGHAPPPPTRGNAYDADLPQLATSWEDALAAFSWDKIMPRIFSNDLRRNLMLTKKQELGFVPQMDEAARTALYLERV